MSTRQIKIRKKVFLIICSIVVVLGIATYASTSQILKTNQPEIIELKGQKIIFGKWGDKDTEFGIKWDAEKDFPFTGPAIQPAVDKDGNVYMIDGLQEKVKKFSSKGKHILSFKAKPSSTILLDKEGRIYLEGKGKVRVFSNTGQSKDTINVEDKDFILSGTGEDGNLIISNLSNNKMKTISVSGETEKDFSFYKARYDREKEIIELFSIVGNKELKSLEIKVDTKYLGKLSRNWVKYVGKTLNNEYIIIARRLKKPRNYMILYVSPEQKKIIKVYEIPWSSDPTMNEWPPVFGLDGNVYHSGYSAKKGDPDYGGYWVKKFEIPDEDKPKW